LFLSILTTASLLAGAAVVSAQQPPPINGVTGTVALEGTVQQTYDGAHTVIVKTVEGLGHLFHLTERTVVHDGKALDDDVLGRIQQGSSVVVEYAADGTDEIADEVDEVDADGLKTIEGVITHIDRRAKTLSIRFADGSRQTLRLTERAADGATDSDGAAADTTKVVVYVGDEGGQPVAHYFKRIS
jgi:hypothetical protein